MNAAKRGMVVVSGLVMIAIVIGVVFAFSNHSQNGGSFGDYFLNAQVSEEDKFEKIITESIDMNDELSVYAKNLLSGGPAPDGIASIDDPKFVSQAEADAFLTPVDQVFVITVDEETRIYPQQILVWHEVVNDIFSNNQYVSLTYSPLTGSAVAFDSIMGTSGLLLNSNTVYYDRKTESLWPQLLGTSIAGVRRGQMLETIPVKWMRWEDAKTAHAQAVVLSRETGSDKSYGFDPYGSYAADDSYYQTGKPFFPLMNEDDRLDEKEIVFGYFENEIPVAVRKSSIPLPDAEEPEAELQLSIPESAIEVMWFAWSAFYPETSLVD